MSSLSRRDFLKITAVAGGTLVGGSLLKSAIYSAPVVFKETRSLMGTRIHLTLVATEGMDASRTLEATFAEMERLIAIFSTHDAGSAVSQLNRDGVLQNAPAELISMVASAREFSEISNGAFDITVKPLADALRAGRIPGEAEHALVNYRHLVQDGQSLRLLTPGMQITFDAIAKGYIVDQGVEVLKTQGFDNVLVEAGGDLMAIGHTQEDNAWEIGIEHPRQEQFAGVMSKFSLSGAGVATSGDYFNAFTVDKSLNHIIDPQTGVSPLELASATALAPNAKLADAISTTIMVLGAEEGLALVNRLDGVEALIVTKDLTVRRTAGFPHNA